MNDKIKQLAEQAGMHDFVLEAMGIGEEFEKFAKLIVRECISTLDRDDGATHHNELLLEHFGVEE